MLNSPGKSEKFKGSSPSTSPTGQEAGVFSLCQGGVPAHGAFARIPGKIIKAFANLGGVISIAEFGKKIVIQYFSGIVIYDNTELFPNVDDFVYDNEDVLVVDNFGLPVIN